MTAAITITKTKTSPAFVNNVKEIARFTGLSYGAARWRYIRFLAGSLSFRLLMWRDYLGNSSVFSLNVREIARFTGLCYNTCALRYKKYLMGFYSFDQVLCRYALWGRFY